MQFKNSQLLFSPSDLITFMSSPYASGMERLRVMDRDKYDPLMDGEDPLLASLAKKGLEHESSFTEALIAKGQDVLETKRATPELMARYTIEAMQDGKEIITQGYLAKGQFAGLSDYLAKVPGPSKLGDYHYEVWDTKLSKKLKPYFAIQLCCYAEMLEHIQGVRPNHITIVTGDNQKHVLWTDHYFAYYRALKKAFLSYHDHFDATLADEQPDPANSREHGRWSELAHSQLVKIDHLSQVANLRHQQISNLSKAGIETMQQLTDSTIAKIPNMQEATFQKAKKQSALQIASRGQEIPVYEILRHETGVARGLALLPPHNDLDVFFDIEGDPGMEGGLEYLWGNSCFDEQGKRIFKDFWAHDHQQEKQVFIEFIDWIYARWLKEPDMHVYHYAPYEITAIRKLMGRYGVREEQVDNLLRNNVFVDLYKIVRHGLMIGEPRYSIKNVEHIYRGKRETDVASGGESVVVYEAWRENPDGDTWQTSKVLNSIRDYNIDDCDSTQELTAWLRKQQAEHGITFLDPGGEGEQEVPEEVTEITLLRDHLLEMAETSDEPRAKLLEVLAWSLEFHRRENKPVWWRLFDRKGLSELEFYEDMDCLAGLVRTNTTPFKPTERARNMAYEYRYDPDQPFRGQARSYYVLEEEDMKLSSIEHDPEAGLICFQSKQEPPRRLNVLPDEYVRPAPIPEAIKAVTEEIFNSDMAPCAITDFLTRSRPRIKDRDGGPVVSPIGDFLADVISASVNLDDSYLCIQGPPGAGKTYTAKHIIGELLQRGKRVGISSNSHKAILNLMAGVAAHVRDHRISTLLVKAGGNEADPVLLDNAIDWVKSVRDFRTTGPVCFGGTAWVFCNEAVEHSFDYLFIDEAGQVSVANLIGMSQSAKNIILMGDQMQLGQPIQGSHPGESGMSILEYLLEGKATIPADIGIFLPRTYRMHKDVCTLISNQVYEGRLAADSITDKHKVKTGGPIITRQSGICFVPVEHEGNAQASDEEVEAILAIAKELLGAQFWPDENGNACHIGWNDILFVAPYNFQVNKLRAALDERARIGSVDKFQGQEAPIVILSMCASDASESPRGIDFLFSKNRLNVAISRAQALAIVVGNPALATTPVSSLKQMEQVNFFCEIIEEAEREENG